MAGQAEEEVQEVAGGHGGRAALFPGSRFAVSDACPDASTSRFQGTGSDHPASLMLAAPVSSYPLKHKPQPPSQPRTSLGSLGQENMRAG